MKTLKLTKKQFEKLNLYIPKNSIEYVECCLFLIKLQNKIKLLKKFTIENKTYIERKLLNINTILKYIEFLKNYKNIILPENTALIANNSVGYIMPYEENSINLQIILQSPNISLEEKLNLLKQVGRIIEQISNIKNFPYKLHLGDIHEGNFIITKEGHLKVIDIDSVYISNNKPFNSKYLFLNPIIYSLPYKYKINDEQIIIPSKNTDIYCYIIILLNTISKAQMWNISLSEFYNYINYLEDLEISKSFLYCLEKIYKGGENENPLYYLDTIQTKNLYQAHRLVYKQRTGIILPPF